AVGASAATPGISGGSGGLIAREAESGLIKLSGASTGGAIAADAASGGCGGSVSITQDFAVGAAVTVGLPITVTGPGTSGTGGTASDGAGGSVCFDTEDPTTIAQLIDGTGGGGGGGFMELDSVGTLTADGGSAANSSGGAITLVAGSPDLPGDLTLNGSAHARGNSTLPNAFGTADLDGCTVHIASTGIVDTTGDRQARNTITARKALVV